MVRRAGVLAASLTVVVSGCGAPWSTFFGEEDEFCVSLPGTPTRFEERIATPWGEEMIRIVFAETHWTWDEQGACYVMIQALPVPVPGEPDVIEHTRQELQRRFGLSGKASVGDPVKTELGGHRAWALAVESSGMTLMTSRSVVSGSRLYTLVATGKLAQEGAERFFGSFHLGPSCPTAVAANQRQVVPR